MKRIWRTQLTCLLSVTGLITLKTSSVAGPNEASLVQDKNQGAAQDPFKGGFLGNGRAADGTMLGLASFDTPSGERVGVTTARFRSPKAARENLQAWTASAAKIIHEGPYKDTSGRVVGYRVIAQFAKTERQTEYHVVTWTSGREFYWVASNSLETVLAEEKDLVAGKNNGRPSESPK